MSFRPSAIANGLVRSSRRTPHRSALVFQRRDYTYGSLTRAVTGAAARLAALGVRDGDRVAFLARNSDTYIIGWLATQVIGAVHVPINFMLGAAEVAYILGHAAPRALFTTDEFAATAKKAVEGTELAMHVLPLDELRDLEADVELQRVAAEAPPQVAQLAYTSGTESAPKGALLTDRGLVYEYMSCVHAGDYSADDVMVHALPLYHCAQMHCFVTPELLLGARNIVLERADAGEIIQTIRDYAATSFFAPPTVWIGILGHPSFDPQHLKSLQKGYYGASIMPKEVLRAMREALPWLRLWNYYGQTEIGPLATALRPEEHEQRPTSAGRPVLFVETRVVDDDMRDVAPGQIGEIVHRSPQLLQGYYRDPVRTEEAFRGGWFHSGDLATRDPDGYLEIVDRKKDMIKSGGENVASREVEETIYRHPAVREVAVIGLPDPKWVERVCAVVVLKTGATAQASDIIDHVSTTLAPFKRPKEVVFVSELPKNPSGKILKRDLRTRLADTASH